MNLEERRGFIGGSDIPIILGLSKYKTPYQLWAEKTGLITDDYKETELQYWGKLLEPIIRDEFARRNKVEVHQLDTIIHPEYNYLRAHIDGYIAEKNAVLEIKCADKFTAHLWEEAGTDGIPMQYLVQVAYYCHMTSADSATIAVLIGGNDYREYVYTRDVELEESIIDAAHQFWDAVQNNIAPEAVNIADVKLMHPKHDPDTIVMVNYETDSRINDLAIIKEKIKSLKNLEEEHKFEIAKFMGKAECITDLEGKPLVTFKANKRGARTFLLKGVTENKNAE